MVATVQMIEVTGDPPGTANVAEYLHLLHDDFRSGGQRGFAVSPIRPGIQGSPGVSMERWIRFRFQQPFTQVYDFYFYAPDLVVPPGWEIRFGTTTTYQTPSGSDSAIATGPVPMTKTITPNAGGLVKLDGTQEQYSDWIVLQARVGSDAPVGPMLGFDSITKQPTPLQYRFDWTEL